MNSSPRYIQIQDFILEKINTHVWLPGNKIPTELELTKQFNVSRMTVNKAIRDLVNQGLLERTPRLGTFVCQKKVESSLSDIRNIADEIRQRGKAYSNKILRQVTIPADDEIAMRLGVRIDTPIFFSEIIHYEDDVALQLEVRWVNPQFAPDYITQDFSLATPNEYLTKNCPLSSIEHTVEAVMPITSIQQHLNLTALQPCLLLNRRTWSKQDLISVALLYHPADKYKLSLKTEI
ncbi:histidine utilization repressor [Moritella sp. Urea-trap-13]|uniref:histidine utilization repressor n=1 Tax=Moritella sp. Urea-trap-13 TaxID=2058327 RepID=UPI000C32C83F|nr:histidine utilization repressor [Moritella sp. Urea-trap-13]PKH05918.1 histidine utilization repressor [Moritella sp. Urea-trap-13]